MIADVIGTVQVDARLGRVTAAVRRNVSSAVLKSALQLSAYIKSQKLSGQVLKVRTGRLRASITHRMYEQPGSVFATVGTNVVYGRVHEFGLSMDQTIRSHMRLVSVVFGRVLAQPVQVSVRSHTRHVNLPARAFMRPALEERRDEITKAIETAAREQSAFSPGARDIPAGLVDGAQRA